MCMACNNRLCAVCHRRYGDHNTIRDLCPAEDGTYGPTSFERQPRKPPPLTPSEPNPSPKNGDER